MRKYASETSSGCCAGCTRICEATLPEPVPVGDVMRYLMYARSYGDPQRAKAEFSRMKAHVRQHLAAVDYTAAEKQCPQGLRISQLVAEAIKELA
jgi:predicted aldo/keto reductase-like oxidoreductase